MRVRSTASGLLVGPEHQQKQQSQQEAVVEEQCRAAFLRSADNVGARARRPILMIFAYFAPQIPKKIRLRRALWGNNGHRYGRDTV